MRKLRQQLPRFAAVGIVATCLHLAVATLAHALGVEALAANALGFFAALPVSYAGNLGWTFAVPPHHSRYMPRFIMAAVAGLLTSHGIVAALTAVGAPFASALAAVALIVPAANFLVARHLVFASAEHSHLPLAPLAAALALAGYAAWMSTTFLNHDTQWYLIAVRRWLDGAVLYRDIIEVNPPLAFILTAPPVGVAREFGFSPATAFVWYTVALLGASLALCSSMLGRMDLSRRHAAGVTVAIAVSLVLYPLAQFGQREHLAIALTLPYCLLTAVRLGGSPVPRRTAVIIGIAAGLGFSLKPYFIGVPLLLALASVRRLGWRRAMAAEHFACLAVGVAYAMLTALAFPQYFSEIVPTARAVYAAGYRDGWSDVLQTPELLGLVAAAWLALRGGSRGASPLSLALILTASGYALAYLWQQKGWFYQAIPIGVPVIAALATHAIGRWDGRQPDWRSQAAIATMLICILLSQSAREGPYDNKLARNIVAATPGLTSASRVYALGQWLRPGVALAATLGGTWCSRFPALWYTPGVARGLAEPGLSAARRATLEAIGSDSRRMVTEDFQRCVPTVVVVEPTERELAAELPAFGYLAEQQRDPAFKALWTRYALTGRLASGHQIWELRHAPLPQRPST